jgi:hypothetical protein
MKKGTMEHEGHMMETYYKCFIYHAHESIFLDLVWGCEGISKDFFGVVIYLCCFWEIS